jgi:hypothetical protein
MNTSTNFSNNATATTATAVPPVQNSFFESVQTSLFTAPVTAAAPTVEASPIHVHCDICSEQDFGTAAVLEGRGWGLYREFQFCPDHEAQA